MPISAARFRVEADAHQRWALQGEGNWMPASVAVIRVEADAHQALP